MNDSQQQEIRISNRQRVQAALAAGIPAAIAMPLILREWAPLNFVILWVALFVVVMSTFSVILLRRPSPWASRSWAFFVALLFTAVPASAVTFSDSVGHFWISATVSTVFVAFQVSALPLMRLAEWRYGVVAVSVVTAVSAFFVTHPLVALALGLILVLCLRNGMQIGTLAATVSDRLKEAEHSLLHDPLTGLLNRRGLGAEIDELAGEDITVVLIDLDHFKLVNDSHGHQVGDQVIIGVAEELEARFAEPFKVARIGGDEFLAIGPGALAVDEQQVAPFRVIATAHEREIPVDCSLSVGVSAGRNDDDAQRLVSEAGFAMRQAKRAGISMQTFELELADQLDRTIQVAGVARGNTEHGTFYPVGQIVFDGDDAVGCELLIRWLTPDGEVRMPGDFLSMAADAGLMVTINNTMLRHAIEFASRFNDLDDPPFVSVNISAPQLADLEFAERVEGVLAEHGVEPDRLMVEITETHQLVTYSEWEITAHKLRTIGVQLAIDDFGRGYSSIERLHHLPISHIKFDRSLVQSLGDAYGMITTGVAQFANALDIGVIAEGIETDEEREGMEALGVTMFQGYLLHYPEKLDEVEAIIRSQSVEVDLPAAA